MYTLQIIENNLFLNENAEICTRLNAIQFRDKQSAFNAREVYYLTHQNNYKKLNIVEYPKQDNSLLKNEWITLKYELSKQHKYVDKIPATFIIN